MDVPDCSLPAGIEDLLREREKLREGRYARMTLLGYAYDIRAFTAWCRRWDRAALPASGETISLYVTDLLRSGRKTSGVYRNLAAIRHGHEAAGLENPVGKDAYSLVHAARRQRMEEPRQAKPISLVQLRTIAGKLRDLGTPLALRDRALLVIGFASALRRSNLCMLRIEDVEINDRGLILHVRKEKQDQESQDGGRLIGLPKGRRVDTDPVRCLTDWLKERSWKPGPLFTRMDCRCRVTLLPMSGEAVRKAVKRSVALIGLDPKDRYSGHSLRSGFITECGEQSMGELLIASQTGHRSMQVLRRYFRRTQLFKANAAAGLDL